jgi:lysozyme
MASKAPRPPLTGKQKLAGGVGASAAALMIALVGAWEGKRNDPYRDIVGVMTVCYGETRVAMRRYSNAECEDMLADGLGDFSKDVLKRNPNLRYRPEILAATTSLSYNIGPAAYARSTVARRFSIGDYRGGCDAFLMWNRAGGRVVQGLQRRREDERRLCLRGVT